MSRPRDVLGIVPALSTVEGGGFAVRRSFPTQTLSMVDPFLLLDHMGPSDYAPGKAKGAPDHPHRGFETVTYMLEGTFEHKDSGGNQGRLDAGDVQWMTAGSGLVHSEMPSAEILREGGRIHGLQLWVNLPAKDKMTRPRYQDIRGDTIPEVPLDGGTVRVIAGKVGDVEAVIDTHTPIQYLHIRLGPGGVFEAPVPAGHQGFVYTIHGQGRLGASHEVQEGQCAVLGREGDTLRFEAIGDWSCLLITGVPLKEPVARWGPFVMNTEAEIKQAFADYQAGKFGTIEPEGLETLK